MSGDSFKLGGSSFAQVVGKIGTEAPSIKSATNFAATFDYIQQLIKEDKVLAGHDVSAGGLITALLEMTFAQVDLGISADLKDIKGADDISVFFSEKPALVLQVANSELDGIISQLQALGTGHYVLGSPIGEPILSIQTNTQSYLLDIESLRDTWYKTSYLLDQKQSGKELATERFQNYKKQPLQFKFPEGFNGQYEALGLDPNRKSSTGIKAAIIREKGVNGDREMAYAMHLAGFDVKDVHMTDLIAGREDLSDVNFIAFVGGFSNSDVLGSAKGLHALLLE